MKLIETPSKVIMLKWDTGDGEIWIELTVTDNGIEIYCDGEIWIELTVTDNGIEIYCDGEGTAELNYIDEECINVLKIQPELSRR